MKMDEATALKVVEKLKLVERKIWILSIHFVRH